MSQLAVKSIKCRSTYLLVISRTLFIVSLKRVKAIEQKDTKSVDLSWKPFEEGLDYLNIKKNKCNHKMAFENDTELQAFCVKKLKIDEQHFAILFS